MGPQAASPAPPSLFKDTIGFLYLPAPGEPGTLRGADNIAAACAGGPAGEQEPLLSPSAQQMTAWSSPCPCFYFWQVRRDPAAISAPSANCSAALPGPSGRVDGQSPWRRGSRQERAGSSGRRLPCWSCRAQWGHGGLKGMDGFRLWCKRLVGKPGCAQKK